MKRLAFFLFTLAGCAGEAPAPDSAPSPADKTAAPDAKPTPPPEAAAAPEAEAAAMTEDEDAPADAAAGDAAESVGARREAKEQSKAKADEKLPDNKAGSKNVGGAGGLIAPSERDAAMFAELASLEQRLSAAGVQLSDGKGAEFAARARASNASLELSPKQCADVCTVSESICSLETKICAMVPDHPGDPRYENACARARSDCALGSAACTSCSG